ARYVNIAAIVVAYVVVIYLVVTGYFSTFMLLILFALRRAFYAVTVLSKPRPDSAPKGFEAFWPTWFSGFCFYHNRMFGGLLILGVLLDTFFRKFGNSLPLSLNWFGVVALGVGAIIAIVRMIQDKAKKAQA
ncbi:MAG: hypothetical protein M1282_15905, partial [Chloroflexi bacterium]|nr:hypothetical protein [Chloroflexota bacterium]